ncbi:MULTISPECIES: FecCD family ABC transporter permease [Sphingomonas]|uniref:Iron chelate uptake ABC transporter family permease subunit n=1 Tax=Sphingomonas carotinifaciens TaxID=1166323 RepID=A0A1G7IT67_9SPHN|nr:iron ABC transporter permease [Sphingomonas carotinifaciens]MBB4084747.1 iron complex transport system permease protein [Sphingomonas carotinifaciens]MWC44134.1 iron chelate uptake ABC transporter family permease subunit [Sphingomonas carotinifaciens]SDF15871.1 iron complex transport system permease protein [Sphingomonas carotinifaciens]
MKRLSLFLLLALIAAALLSVAAGKVWVPWGAWTADDPRGIIIAELRLPRTVLAMAVGAALGLSGAVMQGYLRNPLADPGLFGVSSGAALGAVLSLFFGYAAQAWLLPGFALAGAGVTMALLALIAGRSGSLILFTLAGMILTSIAGSLTTLAISLAPTPFVASEIVTWLIGALTDRSWDDVKVALPLIAGGIAVLATTARSLDALTLGEAAARSIGVDPRRLQLAVIAGTALTVGASVATAGVIGFVGLMVPHLVRPLAGNRPSAILLPSALGGALLVTVADSLVRIAPTVSELRLGVAMSMLGGPFFLYLLIRMRRGLA